MIQSLEEIKKVEISAGQVINGVDNANLMSIDSTEPIQNEIDEVTSEEDIDGKVEKIVPAAEEEEKTEEDEEEEKEISPEEGAEKEKEKETEEKEETEETQENPAEKVKRIRVLTKKFRSAERARDSERTRRITAEEELRKLKATIPDTDKPVREDFEEDLDFIEALTDWKVDSKLKAQQGITTEENTEVEIEQEATELEQELEDVADKGREKYADYDKLVFDKDLTLTEEMIETILLSDIPEELFYSLASNSDKAAAYAEMPALKAARELGKLEAELLAGIPKPSISSKGTKPDDSKTVVKPKKVSKAPEPITPVRAVGVTDEDPSSMTPKEYRRWREKNKE